jgi:ABC-type nitrate/sulfonate/bicarbonate transport system substrate-binding protein
MHISRKSIRLALTALCLLPATTLAGGSVHAQETIKVGYLMQIHDAANFAIERELGAKYKFEYVKFLRYTDAEVALARGDIKMTSLGYVSAIGAALREASPSYVLVSGLSRGAINVVCRPDVNVSKWADIKGKKFGVLTGGPAELFFDDASRIHGIKRGDVPTVSFTAPGPPLLQALKNKDIDCMAVYEPFAAVAVAGGYGTYRMGVDLADNSFLGINGVLAVNAEFLKAHPEIVQDAVSVATKATPYYSAHKDKLVTDFTKRLEFKPEVIKIGADHIILDDKLYMKRTFAMADAMKTLGFIRTLPDKAKLEAYFDYTFLVKATGKSPDELGRDK